MSPETLLVTSAFSLLAAASVYTVGPAVAQSVLNVWFTFRVKRAAALRRAATRLSLPS